MLIVSGGRDSMVPSSEETHCTGLDTVAADSTTARTQNPRQLRLPLTGPSRLIRTNSSSTPDGILSVTRSISRKPYRA